MRSDPRRPARLPVLAAALAAFAGAAFAQDTPAADGLRPILTEDSYWRWHLTMQPPQIGQDGQRTPLKTGYVNYTTYGDQLEIAPPPAGWQQPDFDDAAWPRSRADWFRTLASGRFSSQVIRMRGKFAVTDPKAVGELTLALAYHGGVVVHLNGREVARQHLPTGELAVDAVAEPYPAEAFVDAEGRPIADAGARAKLPDAAKEELAARVARRTRTLGPIRLPLELLRKGVNVLAIELRRTDYHPIAAQWFTGAWVGKAPWWVTVGFGDIRLQAAGEGVVANVARPQGMQIWSHDVNDRVCAADYGDPNEPLAPVRMSAARNGTFCGQVVVASTEGLAGVKVTPGPLAGPGGRIPAANVTASFGRLDMRPYMTIPWFQGLLPAPAAQIKPDPHFGAALLPIWLTVRVPKDAAAGVYRGTVAVAASGKTIHVPVEVSVSDWTLPDPAAFRTYIGVYQSPDSVAMQYGVEPWGERHWQLLDKSFALLGRVGNKLLNILVADETQFGNPKGMVTWIRRADGSYDYDFAIFDRYLQLAMAHCGRQDYVALQIWPAGGWQCRPVDTKLTVQVRDEKSGRQSSMQVPLWGTPEATAFWKPFFAAVEQRLVKLQMPHAMIVGIFADGTAPDEVFRTMAASWPDGPVRWHRGCHSGTDASRPYPISSVPGNVVALHEHCYGMEMVSPYVEALPALHEQRGWPATAYFRISSHEVTSTLLAARVMAERGLWCRKQGIGRVCLDFWPVLKTANGMADIYNRYPQSSCAQREPSLKKMTWPGPDGAEPNIRFELFALGLQEAEALIVLSEAAANERQVGKPLADRCRALLRERLMFCHSRIQARWNVPYYHVNHYGWLDLAKRTYDLAGEAAAARQH